MERKMYRKRENGHRNKREAGEKIKICHSWTAAKYFAEISKPLPYYPLTYFIIFPFSSLFNFSSFNQCPIHDF